MNNDFQNVIRIIPKMKLNRNDVQLRDKILNMNIEERKNLGINKSTLWYLKKNLERELKSTTRFSQRFNELVTNTLQFQVITSCELRFCRNNF